MSLFFGDDDSSPARTPVAPPPPVPTVDTASVKRQNDDSFRRKRGRQASVLTSSEGVGSTPIQQKTLIGS